MFSHPRRRARSQRLAKALVLTSTALVFGAAGVARSAAQTGTVDFTVNNQKVEGFGFAEPFGAAQSVSYLSPALQTQVWDMMFNPKTGAGLDVLRLGINTDSYIEPNSPGSPGATPTYVFDGSDGMQVHAAQVAQHYGVSDFFATSWSAPGFMKTNNSLDNGGELCGEPTAAACATGDWRQAYANFLLQYVKFYGGVGVPITGLDFQNEPDYTATYASGRFSTTEMADFLGNYFGPTVRASGLPIRTMCCDAFNWASQFSYTGTFPYYGNVGQFVDIVTAHEYGYPAKSPQNTTKPTWMTEWATLSSTDNLVWDSGNLGGTGDSDGLYLANDIIQAFNAGNVSEYNYWWGAVNQANALVEVYIGNFAGYIKIPGRYYAMAALSRYVRPGAYRVATTSTNTSLNVVGFRNADGSKVLEVLNAGAAATTANFTVDAGTAQATAKTFLTDNNDSLNETDSAVVTGTSLSVPLTARSLTTVVLPPAVVNGTVQLVFTPTLVKLADGSFEAAVTITNQGTGTAQNLALSAATLGSASGSPGPTTSLPFTPGMGSLAPGGYAVVPMNFPASAGTSGSMTVQRYTGTYAGGTFGGSFRTMLP